MNVSSGDTTDPYRADLLEVGREPLVAGEIQIIQIPHQHNILSCAVRRQSFHIRKIDILPEIRRMTGPCPKTSLFVLSHESNLEIKAHICG